MMSFSQISPKAYSSNQSLISFLFKRRKTDWLSFLSAMMMSLGWNWLIKVTDCVVAITCFPCLATACIISAKIFNASGWSPNSGSSIKIVSGIISNGDNSNVANAIKRIVPSEKSNVSNKTSEFFCFQRNEMRRSSGSRTKSSK